MRQQFTYQLCLISRIVSFRVLLLCCSVMVSSPHGLVESLTATWQSDQEHNNKSEVGASSDRQIAICHYAQTLLEIPTLMEAVRVI